ncbi:MAG: hypothetical protein ACREEM_54525 [Blastocatellia bacterium]
MKWLPKPKLTDKPSRAACAVCQSEYLRGGSFIFAHGAVLDLCQVDARRLRDLPAFQREEAIRELVERVMMDRARWAA